MKIFIFGALLFGFIGLNSLSLGGDMVGGGILFSVLAVICGIQAYRKRNKA